MKTQKGCGFTFEQYTRGDFLYAVSRAIAVFNQPQHYAQIRKNSFDAAIDVADVGRVQYFILNLGLDIRVLQTLQQKLH